MSYWFKKVGVDFVTFIACPWHCCSPPSNLDFIPTLFSKEMLSWISRCHNLWRVLHWEGVIRPPIWLFSSDFDPLGLQHYFFLSPFFLFWPLSEHKVACQNCKETRIMVWRVQDLFLMLRSKASDWQLCNNDIEESNDCYQHMLRILATCWIA